MSWRLAASAAFAAFLDVVLLAALGLGTSGAGAFLAHGAVVLGVAYAASSACLFRPRPAAAAAALGLGLPAVLAALLRLPPLFSALDGSLLAVLARPALGALAAAGLSVRAGGRRRPAGGRRDFACGLGVALLLDAVLLVYAAAAAGGAAVSRALSSFQALGWLFTALLPVALVCAFLRRARLADGLLLGGFLGACAFIAPRLWG